MHFVLCFPASRGLFFLRMRWVEYQNTRILGGKARVIKIEGVVLNRVVYFSIYTQTLVEYPPGGFLVLLDLTF